MGASRPRAISVMTNILIRSEPCPQCGAEMLWTQNAWHSGDAVGAAYRCLNGHVIDPALTRQCPNCGVHDTIATGMSDRAQQYRCMRCDNAFAVARSSSTSITT